jgi:hypothetical protein
MLQEQLLKYKNIKIYLARFRAKTQEVKSFYKIGVTSNYDAADRFRDEEYNPWEVKIMTTAYGPTLEVLAAEDELKVKYPKNLWIDQKIKGVTEIFVPRTETELQEIFDYIKVKRIAWFTERNNTEEPKHFVKEL